MTPSIRESLPVLDRRPGGAETAISKVTQGNAAAHFKPLYYKEIRTGMSELHTSHMRVTEGDTAAASFAPSGKAANGRRDVR